MYWGVFDTNTTDPSNNDMRQKALEARMMTKRRRVLKLAAAAAAIERAQRRRREEVHHNGKQKGSGKNHHESREEVCSICQCEFTVGGDVGTGLQCPASHHMCYECSGIFVASIMSEMEVSYPPKCPLCKAVLPKEQFDRQLTTQQQVAVRTLEAKRKLLPGEVLTKWYGTVLLLYYCVYFIYRRGTIQSSTYTNLTGSNTRLPCFLFANTSNMSNH